MDSPQPPRVRGYSVERLLGTGASSAVWCARVASSRDRVALKTLPITDPDRLRRAESEAALLAALDHPNLIRLHSLVVSGETAVLVLDLADGGSLADLLAARGRLAPGEVITALAPIAAALDYLHGEGVVHADVSPANVLFTAAGVSLLADVGVARLTGDDADAESTAAYIDPAVAAGCVPGPASDVFMLGAVALHALTGAPPWPEASPDAALARAASGVLDDVADRLSDASVPPAMAAVVARALAVDPDRRGSAASFALDFAHSATPVAVEFAAGLARRPPTVAGRNAPPPTQLAGPRPRPVIPRPPRRRNRRAPMVAGTALAAGCVTIAGIIWAHPNQHGRRSAAASTRGTSSQPEHQAETHVSSPSPQLPLVVLGQLDAIRSHAFARRDASLLRQAYQPGPLLRADRALLERIVPRGCTLIGVRTRYTGARVTSHPGRVVVTVTARLASSELVCGGRIRARAPEAGPARLRIVLVQTAAGWRIADQRRLR